MPSGLGTPLFLWYILLFPERPSSGIASWTVSPKGPVVGFLCLDPYSCLDRLRVSLSLSADFLFSISFPLSFP